MLANSGDNIAIAARDLVQLVDHVLRQHLRRLPDRDGGVIPPQPLDAGEPVRTLHVLHVLVELAQAVTDVALEGCRGADVLADLCRIDLHMDDLGVWGEVLEPARDPVIEAHTSSDEQIRLMDGDVVPVHAVHAGHAQIQRVRAGEAADAQESGDDGDVPLLRQLPYLIVGLRDDDPVP